LSDKAVLQVTLNSPFQKRKGMNENKAANTTLFRGALPDLQILKIPSQNNFQSVLNSTQKLKRYKKISKIHTLCFGTKFVITIL
jgi:hypothetical protein